MTPPSVDSSPRLAAARERDRAWTGLVVNALVLPGLGSLACGRRVGWLQMLLSLAGVAATLVWFVWFVAAVAVRLEWPSGGGPYLSTGVCGLAVAVFAWLWSLFTSYSALRRADARRADGESPGPR
jgi:hypothetical protein